MSFCVCAEISTNVDIPFVSDFWKQCRVILDFARLLQSKAKELHTFTVCTVKYEYIYIQNMTEHISVHEECIILWGRTTFHL